MELQKFLDDNQLNLPIDLLITAVTHPSFKLVDKNNSDYEQLETLGDAVLDLLVLEDLIYNFPEIDPGSLTKIRSSFVNNTTLAKVSQKLKIDNLVRSAPEYILTTKDLANLLEAIFGAIFQYQGYNRTKVWYKHIHHIFLEVAPKLDKINPIGKLQEYTQSHQLPLPRYNVSQNGPDHQPNFTASVEIKINDQIIEAIGIAKSKQTSKKKAASKLLELLSQINS